MNIYRSRLVATIIVVALTLLHASTASAATIVGTTAAENLFGTTSADTISGHGGSDEIFGKLGNDRLSESGELYLGAGTDVGVAGPAGALLVDDDGTGGDKLAGNEGDEFFLAADGAIDKIRCGAGEDTVLVDKTDDVGTDCEIVVNASVPAVGSSNVILANNSANTIIGTSGRDVILAKGGNDTVSGGNNVDTILGGSGKDVLNGDAGDDALVDDDGTPGDQLNGGAGADKFLAADGAKTKIDCGAADGFADEIWRDSIDVLLPSCVAETDHVG